MKATVFHGRNDIRIEEVAHARAGIGEAVIRVKLTTLCPGGKERVRRRLTLVQTGRFDPTPLITHRFSLDEIPLEPVMHFATPEASRKLAGGRASAASEHHRILGTTVMRPEGCAGNPPSASGTPSGVRSFCVAIRWCSLVPPSTSSGPSARLTTG